MIPHSQSTFNNLKTLINKLPGKFTHPFGEIGERELGKVMEGHTFVRFSWVIGEDVGPGKRLWFLFQLEGGAGSWLRGSWAVARDEDGKTVFGIIVSEIRVVRLKPSYGPVRVFGVRAGHGKSIVRDDDNIEFGVDFLFVPFLGGSPSPAAPPLNWPAGGELSGWRRITGRRHSCTSSPSERQVLHVRIVLVVVESACLVARRLARSVCAFGECWPLKQAS